ncbi:type II toxin-antitoxin system CcdA family antitoxin [Herbidospora cretacea]|uniref:type II toxin-antitoxin system CcdA family antitoxin n=1 Tax=Herbidospora cretacea TaxID=28444 RepID=UPI00077419FA|nr:type II toxin-antitoxin system CcdA family antitoxin [Herbidospora cretacea]
MASKEVVSVTLDSDLLEYAKAHSGRSLSAYVNEAVAARVQEERRLRSLWSAKVAQADPDHVARMLAHLESQGQ